jgi:VanZ family protein
MAVLFTASGEIGSMPRSSRFLEPAIRWAFPHLSSEALGVAVFTIRKCAHVSEYAVLALLVWRALRKPTRRDSRPWSWQLAGVTIAVAFAYAASDEMHQYFIPSRDASVRDVMLDTVGATIALLLLFADGRRRTRW